MAKFIREKLLTPKYTVVDALPPEVEYTQFFKPYPDYISVPMQSGRRALYRNEGTYTPHDPGDQHFNRFTFVKYLAPKGHIDE